MPTLAIALSLPLFGFAAAPTLRLLRAIADSPAPPHPKVEPGKPSAHRKKSVAKGKTEFCGAPMRDRGEEGAKTAAGAKVARKEKQRVSQNRATRKRPRSSPGSANDAKGRKNPFTAYRLPSPPPSQSSSKSHDGADQQGAKGSRRWSAFDVPEDSDNDIDFTAIRKSGGRVRGPPETPKEGDGVVSSPYALVDLSGIEDDEPSGVAAEEGGKPVEQGLLETFSRAPSEAPLSQEPFGGGDTLGGDAKTPSPSFSPGCDRDQSRKNRTEEEEHGEKEDEEEREIEKQDEKGRYILLASKLSFLVSGNTGRVHVYQEQDHGGDGFGLDGSFEQEDRRPLHCRLVVSTMSRL